MQPGGRLRAPRIQDGCFANVIRAFLDSPKFQKYEPATKDNWTRQLRLAERPDTLGALSVYVIRPALVQAFLDGLSDRPGKQTVAFRALKQLERWAIVRDLLPHPITTGVEVELSDDGHEPWTDEQVVLGEAHARLGLGRVITLAANTGQRGSDLVRMCWSDIETISGRPGINVTQAKTGRKLWVPFTQPLMAALETWERRPGPMLYRPSGRAWTRTRLSTDWSIERRDNPALQPLKDAGLVIHGLRATACVRLSRSGATTRQISGMVGMSEQMVARYCRLSEQKENALAAVIHLDTYKSRLQLIDNKG